MSIGTRTDITTSTLAVITMCIAVATMRARIENIMAIEGTIVDKRNFFQFPLSRAARDMDIQSAVKLLFTPLYP